MDSHVFIIQGDLTQLAADAVAYSTSTGLGGGGHLYSAFRENLPGFADWYQEITQRHRGCRLGDTFWLPLARSSRPHGVLVVVAAGGGIAGAEQARVAVRAAIDTAVPHLRALGCTGRRLLLALPAFRVGGAGDRQAALASARVQIQTAHETLQNHPGIDVVFVAYTPALYQTFLAARRAVLPAVPPGADTDYPELEHALEAGECVLFVGAGLSRGAGMPDWGELMSRLVQDLGIALSDRLDYLDVAQWYRERFGRDRLTEILRQTFGQAQTGLPTLAHYLLLTLPVRYVITTNYDDLLERTLVALKRHPVRVVRQEEVAHTGRERGVYVVKFHGDAAAAADTVLCRDDYDAFFHDRPAMAALLEGLLLNRTFFFVGYGLRDPNFRQIFSRIALMLKDAQRPAFATTFETAGGVTDYLIQQWRARRLTLMPMAGTTSADQEQCFVRFLDRLAERMILRAPRLFLAPDTEVPPQLSHLRHLLAGDVGEELVAALTSGQLVAAAVPHLASVLQFLAQHGWRPKRCFLCHLWELLAGYQTDTREERRLLIEALGSAERFEDVQRIHRRLEEIDHARP